MRALRVVGLGEDGTYVVCEDARGEQFKVPADEQLRAASRGEQYRSGRPAQPEAEQDTPMRPREIQARIRAGESVEHVAQVSAIPMQRVERFAYPVLLERSRTAELAQQAHPVREDGPDVQTLAEVAAYAFGIWGQDFTAVGWDSWRGDDGRWVVQLSWQAGRSENRAHWAFSPGAHGGTVTPLDDHARHVMDPQSVGLRTVPAALRPEPEDVELPEYPERLATDDPILAPPVELVGRWPDPVDEPAEPPAAPRRQRAVAPEAPRPSRSPEPRPSRTAAEQRPAEPRRAGDRTGTENRTAAGPEHRAVGRRSGTEYDTPPRRDTTEQPPAEHRTAADRTAADRTAADRTAATTERRATDAGDRPAVEARPSARLDSPTRPPRTEPTVRRGTVPALEPRPRTPVPPVDSRGASSGPAEAPADQQVEPTPAPAAPAASAKIEAPAKPEPPKTEAAKPEPAKPAKSTAKRGKKGRAAVPSWEDVLLGVRSNR